MNVLWVVAVVVGFAVVAILGFRVRPVRARAITAGRATGTVELAGDLPAPVVRYHRALGIDGPTRAVPSAVGLEVREPLRS